MGVKLVRRRRILCCQGKAGLKLLINPHEALWKNGEANLRDLSPDEVGTLPGRILLFIHGMEYGCPHEVVRDFVSPFEKGAALFKEGGRSDLHCLFLHWDSRTFGNEQISLASTLLSNLTRPLQLGKLAIQTLHDIEMRASRAANDFAPWIEKLLATANGQRPMIITHSLGALLWAEALQAMLRNGKSLLNLGDWWSMQPALTWSAFQAGGEFEAVGALYGQGEARKIIWYSSFDLVLSTLYLLAKGRFAMGQIGAPYLAVEQHNLAFHSREAHGATCVGPRNHTFFERVAKLVKRQVGDLALDRQTEQLATG